MLEKLKEIALEELKTVHPEKDEEMNGYIGYVGNTFMPYKYNNIMFIGIEIQMSFRQAQIIAYKLNTKKASLCLHL